MTDWNLSLISPIMPEIFLSAMALLLVMVGALKGDKSMGFVTYGVIASFVLAGGILYSVSDTRPFDTLNGMLVVNGFSNVMRGLILTGMVFSSLLSLNWLRQNNFMKFEFPLLYLFSAIGLLFMVSSNHFLALYVALELSSLSLYVLAAIKRDHLDSTEAGLKYFILGALSSGLLLFGISLIYGYTGSLNFSEVNAALVSAQMLPVGAIIGMVFILAGLVFKISAVPFHMWTPDVYQGAPTPVTAFFAIVPKIAAFALIIRLMTGPFAILNDQFIQIIIFVSVASMVVGAFAGLLQSNFKRLLAYSSIANMGFALLGLLYNVPEGVGSVILYLAIYMVMTAGVFGILMSIQRRGVALEKIEDFAGFAQYSPLLAYSLAVLLFSMSGIPPMAGFFAKFFVFQAAVGAGYFNVAVVGVLASVVAAYYYLRVIKLMIFDKPNSDMAFTPMCQFSQLIVIVASVAAVILFTFMPNQVMHQALEAAQSLFPQ
ncbi:MAG: NADH-quinone oxidoreductase subunit NuoN [Alphaproteobacteria bacterium]|nr:NADH-quinone oxidoreductase subunit NuoN [Alphaproteobacteria bacterium]